MKYDFELDLETKNSLSILISRIKENSTVLEFGPANGRMTKYLKEKLNCKVYTVEIDEESAKSAAQYSEKIIVDSVENYKWLEAYQDIDFDYIVFADVLEHLYHPQDVIKSAIKLLKEDGSVLLSIPNVSHNAIIIDLLKDRFTYHDIGLLDNTHIRFFTKNTLDQFINQCGLFIQYETGTYAKPIETEFEHNYENIEENIAAFLKKREYGEVYQFIIEAKKSVKKRKIDFQKKHNSVLYFDRGKGFNEIDKVVIDTEQSQLSFCFDLSEFENIKSLRFDVCEVAVEMTLKSIQINASDYTHMITHNGKFTDEKKIKFLHNDPQIIVPIINHESLKKVIFIFEAIETINNLKEQQLEEVGKQLQKKDQIIKEKEKELQKKEQKIQKKNQLLQQKEQLIYNRDKKIQSKENEIIRLHKLAQSLLLKSRLKRIIKKFIPIKFINILKYIKQNPNIIKRSIHLIKMNGFKALFLKIDKINAVAIENSKYFFQQPILTDEVKVSIDALKHKPLFSIIMPVYNVDSKWLDLAIKSIETQWYENWELCIVDDNSSNPNTLEYLKAIQNQKIKTKFLQKNGNISKASNEALALSIGEYIVLMDNDDELTPDALYEVVKVINENGAEFIYSDEDKIEMDGTFCDPHFKPDFAPDMFLSQNYISHLGVIKKTLIEKVGGFTVGLEGSQDYDLYLKILEHTNKISHISKVLYHWRKIPGSTAAEFGEKSYAQEAGRKALENAMKRREIIAIVENGLTGGTYKINYKIWGEPLVSIIIPFRDKPGLLKVCIESILKKSTYQNYEIIGISNNSQEEQTFTQMQHFVSLDKRVNFYEYNVHFNYSKINNYAVREYAKGEHVILLNNDIEIITPAWIEELLMHSQRNEIGSVGAKLYFPNNTIQHAGLVIAPFTDHAILSMYRKAEKNSYGYFSRLKCINNYSAVTAACLMIKKSLFEELGGFDEINLKVAYNDVDLCLSCIKKGKYNIFTPFCEAYHHESVSRGYEENLMQIERREKEKSLLKTKHTAFFSNSDKFYNKNLTLSHDDSKVHKMNTDQHIDYIGLPFTQTIVKNYSIKGKQADKICLFSHFSKTDNIDDYVIYYISKLSELSDIIFISTAENMKEEAIEKIKPFCRNILIKKNYGYDFGAWKSGMLLLGDELNKYEQLILCNDSVYGPLYDLEYVFKDMDTKGYDIWSISDNYQIAYHLQSYFVVYNKNAIQNEVFVNFWKKFKIYKDKATLIEKNEINFSTAMQESGLKVGAFCSSENYSYLNIMHYYWKDLIIEKKCPFIKRELLQYNPMNIDIAKWENIINQYTKYKVDMIKKNLKI